MLKMVESRNQRQTSKKHRGVHSRAAVSFCYYSKRKSAEGKLKENECRMRSSQTHAVEINQTKQ